MITKSDILDIVNTINARNWRKGHKKIENIYNDIIEKTNFLPEDAKLNERFYCFLNNITDQQLCQECKKNKLKYKSNLDGYKKYCSHRCASNSEETKRKTKETCLEKYGSEFSLQNKDIRNKGKSTCLEKYGVEYATQSKEFKEKSKRTCRKKYGVEFIVQSQEYKEKSKQTCLDKYGVEYSTQSKSVKAKIKETNQKKYGVDTPLQNKKIRKKYTNTLREKYGVDHVLQNKEIYKKYQDTSIERYSTSHPNKSDNIKHKLKQISLKTSFENLNGKFKCEPLFSIGEYNGCKTKYKWKCNICNNIFVDDYRNGTIPRCNICHPKNRSISEQEIGKYIKKFNIGVQENCRNLIKGKEIDLYVPDKKVAIEFNGIYWHSSNNSMSPKNRNYHLDKTKRCEEMDIQLIHIFEDEWLNKQEIVKSRLKHILGMTKYKIYGRKCIIKEIDYMAKNKFLNKYHIQGADKSKVKLGAFYKNRLVAVMTFGKRKITGAKQREWELIRYCSISNFSCIGIAGKLLKFFENNYKPKIIISYADKRWSNGKLYYSLGFSFKKESPPNYWYMDKSYSKRLHRSGYQKHMLKNKLESFDPELSEWENMKANGYDRIWDCGNMVFELNL